MTVDVGGSWSETHKGSPSSDDCTVSGYSYRDSELIADLSIGGFELLLENPVQTIVSVDVGCAADLTERAAAGTR